MGFLASAKDVFIVSSIVSLLALGVIVSLRSGVVAEARDRGRQLWSNLSGLILALAGCVTVLLVLQEIVGIRIGSRW